MRSESSGMGLFEHQMERPLDLLSVGLTSVSGCTATPSLY